ncbi:MAG: CPCC family cysteine-rich protein [Gemmatales bacterium]
MNVENSIPTPDELARRLAWHDEHPASDDLATRARPLRCPCCGCNTISKRMMYEICPVCCWEDDGQDEHNAEDVRGGANGLLSLLEARQNYLKYGACSQERLAFVRPAVAGEVPPGSDDE